MGSAHVGVVGTKIGKSWVSDEWDRVPRVAASIDSNSNSNEIQMEFKSFPKFDQSKKDFPELENFEIKYGCEGFEERNNLIHRNIFRFKMDFK
jgi:uncharacterized protein YdhG (YjbR/CyaY superfamily)